MELKLRKQSTINIPTAEVAEPQSSLTLPLNSPQMPRQHSIIITSEEDLSGEKKETKEKS